MIKATQIAPAEPGYQVHYFERDPRERVTPGGTCHPVVGWVVDERGKLGAAFILDGAVHSTTEWDDTREVVATIEPVAAPIDERTDLHRGSVIPSDADLDDWADRDNMRLVKMLRDQGVTGRILISHSTKGHEPRFPPAVYDEPFTATTDPAN
ncbi:hypothetical protein [Williamsia muralis]|uniref:Abasic site processing protein n=1 Tax=Williamsia marianensis TaxID=85044 RepID=A0ABU4F0H6_WILMA|nr:hypothetical protein [Williamsia muralis]MDV7137013.1 hypothetical protein [Williamsia muralis]